MWAITAYYYDEYEKQLDTSLFPVWPNILQTRKRLEYSRLLPLFVVVVESHIQRIVLAAEETTATQQVSHRAIKSQSCLWSQTGTKVNGSHHGDNPLLRPTGIQIATKSYAASRATAPTNTKTVQQTSLLYIESNLNRIGMLPPTHDHRSQQKNWKNYAPTSFDQQAEIRKLKYRGPWWWRSSAGEASARASIEPSKALCILEKAPQVLPVCCSLWPS